LTFVRSGVFLAVRKENEIPPTPRARSTTFWLNKRALTSLELPLPHTFQSRTDGWAIEFSAAGRIVVTPTHGGKEQIDVESGDMLIASGEELYLKLK
jgi:hypothetical protein